MIRTRKQLEALVLVGCAQVLPPKTWREEVHPLTRRSMKNHGWVATDPLTSGIRLTNDGLDMVIEFLDGFASVVKVVNLSQGAPTPYGTNEVHTTVLDMTVEEAENHPYARAKKVFGRIIVEPGDEFRVFHTLGAYMPVLCILEDLTPPWSAEQIEQLGANPCNGFSAT